ncbi:unnamed protein product [Blepharisma stoltei]|uniref:Tetratricopeptide repeat protein n=1 Tax=Blepharisma stoltei TaxID=1481888 RepID=A0AAU9I8L8_9CILI|nr:unnamed protein product [Blepharisma stoltei]
MQEAIEEYKKAIDANIKAYGRDHPKTYQYLSQLGSAYRTVGKIQEAMEAHNDALEIGLTLFGENDFNTGFIYSGLAKDYRDLQFWDKSIQLHNKAINIYKQCYDRNRDFEQYYWSELYCLGETYEAKGDIINALQNYPKVKGFYNDTYGENHEFVAEIQTKIDSIKAT